MANKRQTNINRNLIAGVPQTIEMGCEFVFIDVGRDLTVIADSTRLTNRQAGDELRFDEPVKSVTLESAVDQTVELVMGYGHYNRLIVQGEIYTKDGVVNAGGKWVKYVPQPIKLGVGGFNVIDIQDEEKAAVASQAVGYNTSGACFDSKRKQYLVKLAGNDVKILSEDLVDMGDSEFSGITSYVYMAYDKFRDRIYLVDTSAGNDIWEVDAATRTVIKKLVDNNAANSFRGIDVNDKGNIVYAKWNGQEYDIAELNPDTLEETVHSLGFPSISSTYHAQSVMYDPWSGGYYMFSYSTSRIIKVSKDFKYIEYGAWTNVYDTAFNAEKNRVLVVKASGTVDLYSFHEMQWDNEVQASEQPVLFLPEVKRIVCDVKVLGAGSNQTVTGEVIKAILQTKLGIFGVPENYLDYITSFKFNSGIYESVVSAGNKTFLAADVVDNFTIKSNSNVELTVLPSLLY